MYPWADNQLLTLAGILGRAMLAHTREIPNRAAEEYVVPAPEVESRHGDIRMGVFNADRLPVLVVFRVGQPVVVVGGNLPV